MNAAPSGSRQDCVVNLRRDLEDDPAALILLAAAIVGDSAVLGSPVEIAVAVEYQAAIRFSPIAPAGEIVKVAIKPGIA